VLSSPLNTRRWARHHVDVPVRIVILNGLLTSAVHGRATEISRSGMAVRSTLALKLGDKMQVQFQTNPSGVTAVVRYRKGDCFGLEFLPQLSAANRTLHQSTFVCNLAGGGTSESQESAGHSCTPKTLLAGLRRKLLEIEQVQREIDALNLSILLLADDERKNPESSLQRRLNVEMRPWPSLS
jgi:hypothetical protein